MSETSEFNQEVQIERIRSAASAGGAEAVIAHIGMAPAEHQLKLYALAQREMSGRSQSGTAGGFDDYIRVARAGIDEALRRSKDAHDPENALSLKDTANVFSYNLAADLAECWPNDTAQRERRHFEEGLRASDDCIRWREELQKPPSRKAMGWWGRGMHLLSLGESALAAEAFRAALNLTADESGNGEISDQREFDQILYAGYLGLAELANGEETGRERYHEARAAFEAQLESDARKEDAEFGLAQLTVVEQRFIGG